MLSSSHESSGHSSHFKKHINKLVQKFRHFHSAVRSISRVAWRKDVTHAWWCYFYEAWQGVASVKNRKASRDSVVILWQSNLKIEAKSLSSLLVLCHVVSPFPDVNLHCKNLLKLCFISTPFPGKPPGLTVFLLKGDKHTNRSALELDPRPGNAQILK